MKEHIKVFGYDLRWLLLVVFYPFFCRALYQDSKAELPLWAFLSACLIGGIGGVFLIKKVVEPLTSRLEQELDKLFGMEEPKD